MQTALRKMGNSTGMIVPKSILGQIGLEIGAEIALSVEDGRLIGTPIASDARAGWADAAAAIGLAETDDERAWRGFANDEDRDLAW